MFPQVIAANIHHLRRIQRAAPVFRVGGCVRRAAMERKKDGVHRIVAYPAAAHLCIGMPRQHHIHIFKIAIFQQPVFAEHGFFRRRPVQDHRARAAACTQRPCQRDRRRRAACAQKVVATSVPRARFVPAGMGDPLLPQARQRVVFRHKADPGRSLAVLGAKGRRLAAQALFNLEPLAPQRLCQHADGSILRTGRLRSLPQRAAELLQERLQFLRLPYDLIRHEQFSLFCSSIICRISVSVWRMPSRPIRPTLAIVCSASSLAIP